MHMAQLMPLPRTVSCSSKIQAGFTFLVPAHPGSPGQGAGCVCVCVCALCTCVNHRHQLYLGNVKTSTRKPLFIWHNTSTDGSGVVNMESELWSAKSSDICDELSRLLYMAGSTLHSHTNPPHIHCQTDNRQTLLLQCSLGGLLISLSQVISL